MIELKLGFEARAFAEAITQEIATSGIMPVFAAEHFIAQQFAACIKATFVERLIKLPTIRFYPYNHSGYSTLAHLARVGSELWYTDIGFSTKNTDFIEEISVSAFGFIMEEIDYGFGISRCYQLKSKQFKTQNNYSLRLNHIRLPSDLWETTLSFMKLKEPLNQPYIANPSPSLNDGKAEISIPGHRLVSFDHMLDGSRIFCSCSQVTHEKMKARAQSVVAGYVAGSWPQKTLQLLGDATYQDSICHLCIARGSGAAAAALRYGDNVQAFEESYIDQFTIGLDMDARTAKAEVQQQLSLSRWKSEAELFAIIKKLFAGTIVQREASPAWLGRQRLDIYLPDLSLAIEYQGQQHFQAVALFGGEQGTRRAMERDALKQQLCQENGVSLIQVLHSDALTLPSIRHRLRRYLPQSV